MSIRSLIMLSLLITACSPPAETVGTDIAAQDDAVDVSGEPDTARWDTAPSDLTGDLPPETRAEDLVTFDEASPCEPGDGCFGDPCATGTDCLSGYCVLHMGEQVCSDLCVEECPAGFECRQVAQAEPDVVFICASLYPALCLPCAADAECSDLAGPGSSCINYGPGGHFCGVVCAAEDDCPAGTTCEQVATVEGLLTTQCVHETGACPCTAYAVATGATALCSDENEHGKCQGFRACTEEGLTPCDAATPTEEICNGEDDDCDGDTDEVDCDDGNACTEDLCEGEGGCTHTAATGGECLDGDACTIGDHCEAGVCVGSPLSCDDGNECTVETCDSELGCLYEFTTDPCNDGDPCSVGDTCLAGTCVGLPGACDCMEDADCLALVGGDLCMGQWYCSKAESPFLCVEIPGSAVTCPESEGVDQHCYDMVCQPDTGECVEIPTNGGGPCEEGDACTVGDICNVGVCVSGPAANCNDGNPCTDDSCSPDSGCVHALNNAPCDDGDFCTVGDICSLGTCLSGQAMVCDDGNPCTSDSCVDGIGCQFSPAAGDCDDGNACTTGDHCAGGWCVPQEMVACDDGDPCTDDSCDLVDGCTYSNNTAPCDDEDACTVVDVCADGACVGSGAPDCDDVDACTQDSCDPDVGCVHADITPCCGNGDTEPGEECDDGNNTSGDGCSDICNLELGNCSNGSTVDCNPPGTTLIQSSRFVDPSPPDGWTQCAGFVNTSDDDVSNTFLSNCLNTTRLRVRAWNGGSLEEDVYTENMNSWSSWPDWNYLGGSMTKLKSTYWTGGTTYFSTQDGNDACSLSCCNAAPGGTMTLGTGNGSSAIFAPGNTNDMEWRVNCGGQAITGRKIAVYR